MLKKIAMNALIIVTLFLLVPVLIGNITARILETINPPPAYPLVQVVERTKAITRTALLVVGVYYVLAISGWIVLRRLKRKASRR